MRGLLVVIWAFVVTGCTMSNSHHIDLDTAERLMTVDPEEAFERLNVIDVSEFADSSTMARWALLYSDAMMRCRLAVPSDTIISIAVRYYASCGEQSLLARSKEIQSVLSAYEPEEDALLRARYLQKVREYSLYKERQRRNYWILWGVVILFVSIGIMWSQHRHLLQQTYRNEALLAQAASLRDAVEVEKKLTAGLSTVADRQFSKRFRLIDHLCSTYYENQGTASERNAIAREVKREIETLKCDSRTFAGLEAAVADVHGDWLALVKESLPHLSSDDYQLLIYLICGFSPQAISIFIGEKVETVYKRKSRLKGRIFQAGDRCKTLLSPIF